MKLSEITENDLIAALKEIAEMDGGSDEWDEAKAFAKCKEIAKKVLKQNKVSFKS
jgi:hypothetical protein